MEIQDFDLTEEDFALIMKGLEALPSSGLAGELVGKLLLDTLPPSKDPNVKARVEAQLKMQERRRTSAIELLTEEVRLLQGKLIAIKRKLAGAGALKQARDILKPRDGA